MFVSAIRRLVTVIFVCAIALSANAQQIHFIYLQTENSQPFYVKINNKVTSSSSTGYLILPKLTDGVYKLNVGFPKKEFPEQNFQVLVEDKNQGFLLKNFGEKGWGLFNMQSFAIVLGESTHNAETVTTNAQSDPFSKMLASVVKDSSILQKSEPLKEIPAVAKADSTVADKEVPVSDKIDSNGNVAGERHVLLISPPTKFLSKGNNDGLEMIYIDSNETGNDTIRIFIPTQKAIVKTIADTTNAVKSDKPSESVIKDTASMQVLEQTVTVKSDTTASVSQSIPVISDTAASLPQAVPAEADTTASVLQSIAAKADTTASVPQSITAKADSTVSLTHPVFLENIQSIKNEDSIGVKKTDAINEPGVDNHDSTGKAGDQDDNMQQNKIVVLPKVLESSATNSDCKGFADNEDFLKLRKKMASESSDDYMIKMATKAFHSRCFSTEQIKNLSLLFLTNEGKYRFFDLSYAFVSNSDQFYTLQSQLTDNYYINRFKAMIDK
ncbi:MAG: hypothetical protein ABI472_24070 [Ginsengibacter sp.]